MASSFRAFRAAFRLGQTVLRSPAFSKYQRFVGGAGGVTTGLAISFWGTSKTANSDVSKLPSDIPNFAKVIQDADALYNVYLIDNCFNILKKFSDSDNTEILWRLARVICEKGKLTQDPEGKRRLMYEAYALIQKALKNEPKEGSFGAHKWYAILLDYIGELEGNKSRIEKSNEVKQHLERALEINDKDATTWHILGLWHFSFADMSYATRLVAKTIYSSPPISTYEDALKYFLKAEEIDPGFYKANLYYIGEVYDRLGKKEEAKEYYKKAFKTGILSVDDNVMHNKAYEKCKKYGVKDEELSERHDPKKHQ